MKDWNSAVNKFLDQWKNKEELEGAILSGSHAVGNQSESSDIDIMIVLSNKTKWWQRGNLKIGGYMIEYIADPISMWRKSFEDDFKAGRKVSISMFAMGKVLLDKNGLVAKLKENAESIMKKPLKKMETREIEMAKYHLWDGISKLRSLYKDGFPKYSPLYFLHLSKIINYYASFLGISLPAVAKIDKFLNDAKFRKMYMLEGFKDKTFIDLVNSCLLNYSSLKAIEKINTYVIDKLGGFEINGWTLKTEIKK